MHTMIDLKFLLIAFVITMLVVVGIVKFSTRQDIQDTFKQLKQPWYWQFYNIAEWVWIAVRMSILIPIIIFGQGIWQLYYLGFAAAIVLVWTSIKKKLPEFAFYYSFWVWLSACIILSHLFQ